MIQIDDNALTRFPRVQDNSNKNEQADSFFIQSQLNDFVIEVTGSGTGGKICMAKLNGSQCQRWKLTEEGQIQSEFNNFVLGIKHSEDDVEIQPCAPVISCVEDTNCHMQKWVYNEEERQIEFLGCKVSSSNLVLDIAWANMAQGATLHLWPKNHGASQTWTLVKKQMNSMKSLKMSITAIEQTRWVNAELDLKHDTDQLVPPRSFYIESSINGKVLEISSEETGANLMLSEKDGTDGQIWCYDNRHGLITSEMNGLVIDIRGDDLSPGAEIIMYERNEGDNQKWNLLDNGCIQSKFSGHALEIIRGYQRKNNMIHVNNISGLRNQQWNFFPLDTSPPEPTFFEDSYCSFSAIEDFFGSFYIQSVKTGLTLSAVKVREEKKEPGANRFLNMIVRKEESWTVRLTRKKKNDLAQKWTLTDDNELKSELNGLVLDVVKSSLTRRGFSLILYEQNDGINQKWKFCDDGRIEAKMNGMVIENVSLGDNASAHVTLKPRCDSDLQLWEWEG